MKRLTLLILVLLIGAASRAAPDPSVRWLTAPVDTSGRGVVQGQREAPHVPGGNQPALGEVRESAVGWHPYADPVPGGASSPAPLSGSGSGGLSGLTSSMLATSLRDGRTGIVTHMGPGYPAGYLAIPIGPGHRVEVCGPRTCLTLTSTDAGPNRAMLQAGRIADVSVELFRRLCCDPSRGVFAGSWRRVDAGPTLPPTDTAP